MEYLNRECLQSLSPESFRKRQPYPWVQIDNALTPDGYARLRSTLPPLDQFERRTDKPRVHGLAPHDRYVLHFRPRVQVEEPWLEFIRELEGPVYEAFLLQMFGYHDFRPTFEWYYAGDGCGMAPQRDAARRLATQVFYFNTAEDWKPEWGGQILILNHERHSGTESRPQFEQFGVTAAVEPLGNGSLLLQRTRSSWRGVRPLDSPPGKLQRLFVVSVNIPCLQVWWRGIHGQDPDGYRLKAA